MGIGNDPLLTEEKFIQGDAINFLIAHPLMAMS